MRGTSFSGDKLTGDFGKELEDRFIGDGTNLYFLTKKLVPNHFGLLQQYRPDSDDHICSQNVGSLV